MIIESIGAGATSALTAHILKWITNLGRASSERKNESIASLEKVILAVRKTAVYCRALDEGQDKDYEKEAEISMEWTDLAMELDTLKLHKLAKKCRVKGWYWEDQGRFDKEFLEKAQISFSNVERLARQLLDEINTQ